MLNVAAKGVYVIAVTPFKDNGALDLEGTDRLVDFYLECGVSGMTILGQMGEAPKLDAAESRAFVQRVLARVAGRVPVVVGVSAAGFAAMSGLTRSVMDMGAAGVMIAPTSGLKGDDGIVGYYRNAVEAIGADVPVVVQDYPLTTNVFMPVSVVQRIVRSLPSCVMLKHEDWPGLDKISAIRAGEARGETARISILCGNGGLFLPQELDRGADGAMTGYCYPEMLVEVCNLHAAGKRAQAYDLFDIHLPLVRYEQQLGLGLGVRKYMLKRRGALASAAQRQPAAALTPETVADIEWIADRLERRLMV